jgi:hypothetical protein
LEALSDYRAKKEAVTLATLISARTPNEAYAAACEYKGMMAFVRDAEANVKVGNYAMTQIIEEEMTD